jgi:hypothetical protein
MAGSILNILYVLVVWSRTTEVQESFVKSKEQTAEKLGDLIKPIHLQVLDILVHLTFAFCLVLLYFIINLQITPTWISTFGLYSCN